MHSTCGEARKTATVRGEKGASLQNAALIRHPWITDIRRHRELTEWGWTKLTLRLEIRPVRPQNSLDNRAMVAGGQSCLSPWRRTVLALGFRRGAGVCRGHCCCPARIP